jgi:hypothetical protein
LEGVVGRELRRTVVQGNGHLLAAKIVDRFHVAAHQDMNLLAIEPGDVGGPLLQAASKRIRRPCMSQRIGRHDRHVDAAQQ